MVHRKYLFTIVGLLILLSCSSSLWDELPGPISEFLSTYYPSSTISSYSEHNGEYYVTVKNGASLTFDSNYLNKRKRRDSASSVSLRPASTGLVSVHRKP